MWDELSDEEIEREMLAASARIEAAQHTLQSLMREKARRWEQGTDRTNGSRDAG